MTTIVILFSVLMAVGTPRLEVREMKATAIADAGVTTFGCLDLGPMPSDHWTVDGIELRAESLTTSLEIVETPLGEQAMASVDNCISDAVPSIQITFSPPVGSVFARMWIADGTAHEDMELLCWTDCDNSDALPFRDTRPHTTDPAWSGGWASPEPFCMCQFVGVDVLTLSGDNK